MFEGFHRLPRSKRLKRVGDFCNLDRRELDILSGEIPFSLDVAEHLIENVVGVFPIPLGIATNFRVDGRDRLIPMAVEETSIIAACGDDRGFLDHRRMQRDRQVDRRQDRKSVV